VAAFVPHCLAKLQVAWREQHDGADLGTPRQTVGKYLEDWLENVVKLSSSWKTYASYADVMRPHAIPALGRHQLKALTPQYIAAMLKEKFESGLSPCRVNYIRTVLVTALNEAIRLRLVNRNVAAVVPAERASTKEVRPYTLDQARALIDASKDHRLGVLFRLALMTGLRQGEVLGLQRQDLDLNAGTVRVHQALQAINGRLQLKGLKTDKSQRTLLLSPALIAALRLHRQQALERQAAGASWVGNDFVFTSAKGDPLGTRNVLRVWHRMLVRIELPPGSVPYLSAHRGNRLVRARGATQSGAGSTRTHPPIHDGRHLIAPGAGGVPGSG
jgi:integrase